MSRTRLLPVLLATALAAVALAPQTAAAQVNSVTVSSVKVGAGGVPSGSVRVVHTAEDYEPNVLSVKVYEWGTKQVGSFLEYSCGSMQRCSRTIALSSFTRADGTTMRLRRNTLYVVMADSASTSAGGHVSYPVFTAFWAF